MNNEIIHVCQVPNCGAMADTWIKDDHEYYFCEECAPGLGWCSQCREYVSPDMIYEYDLCADCLELLPETVGLAEAIDEMVDEMVTCPHCESTDVIDHWCNACQQMIGN